MRSRNTLPNHFAALSRLKMIGWSVTAVVVVLAGFLFAATGYQHGLPYIDFPDEVTIWTMGRAYFDPSWAMFQPEYPPGLLVVSSTIQRAQIAFGDPYPNPAGTIAVMRLTSVFAFTVSVALVIMLGKRLAGPVAGIVAGICWMAIPLANYQAKVATIDAWMCAWFIAAVVAGIEGWYRQSVRWIALSLFLAIIATLFKWQAAAALCLPGLACTTFWKTDRRKMARLLTVYLMIVVAFSYWVVFVHHALEGSVYLPGTHTSVPTFSIVMTNLAWQLTGIGPAFMFGVLPLVALALSVLMPDRRQQLPGQMQLWSFPIIIVVFNVILSFNGAPVFDRQYLAPMMLLASLTGIAIVLLFRTSLRVFSRFKLPAAIAIGAAVMTVLIVQWSNQFASIIATDGDFLRPDRRALFAEWVRATATDGPMLIADPTVAAALQTLYGYRGRPIDTPYNQGTSIYISEDKIASQMITAKGIRYLIVSPGFDTGRLNIPLTRLIAYEPQDERFRGTPWAAYYVGNAPRLLPDQGISFGGEIRLAGFSLSSQSACPGESIKMRLVWRPIIVPTRYYVFFLHLSGEKSGEMSWPINGQQPVSEERPTISWANPDELLLSPDLEWRLPKDLMPDNYRLLVGLFDPVGNYPLRLPDGRHYDVLATINVMNCAAKDITKQTIR